MKKKFYLYLFLIPLLITCSAPEPWLNPDLSVNERVEDLLSRLTLEEKILQLTEHSRAVPRLNIPEYNWWSEGLHGVARAGIATVYPQAIGLAATFNDSLMFEVAATISDEFRAKYNDFIAKGERDRYKGLTVWSPNINIFRDPRWGRGQETYGEDPYLTSRMGVAFVKGLQGDHPRYYKTIATPKHYAVHSGPEPLRHEFDVDVSQRDFIDTYLPAFEACITEGKAQSIMSAYNRFRGESCSGSPYLLTDILREKWGFDGYVVSDCGAIFDIYAYHKIAGSQAEAAAIGLKSGCDLNCGNSYNYLGEAVEKGYCSEEDIDKALRRLLKARFRLGMFDPPKRVDYNKIPLEVNDCDKHKQLALEAARESMVLLKNEDSILPLQKNLGTIGVIGPNADNAWVMYGNYNGIPSGSVTPLQGIREKVDPATEVLYAQGCSYHDDYIEKEVIPGIVLSSEGSAGLTGEYFSNPEMEGQPDLIRRDSIIAFTWFNKEPAKGMNNENYSVRWTGEITIPETGDYTLYLSGDDGFRLYMDDAKVIDVWEGSGWKKESVMLSFDEGSVHSIVIEYYQRDWGAGIFLEWGLPTDNMEQEAMEVAERSDVIIFVGGLSPELEGEEMEVDLSGFKGGDRTSIDLPESQQKFLKKLHATGKPVILVLMNGSALAVNWADDNLPAILEAWYPGQSGGTAIADILFGDYNPAGRLPVTFYKSTEQLPPFENYDMKGRTYRYFEGEALYEFGFGLSYSEFTYTGMHVEQEYSTRDTINVIVELENTGKTDGDEVVQLYLRHPDTEIPVPLHALKGFRRVHLEAGEKKAVNFRLTARDLAIISDQNERVVLPGRIELFAGGQQPDAEMLAGEKYLKADVILNGEPCLIDQLDK